MKRVAEKIELAAQFFEDNPEVRWPELHDLLTKEVGNEKLALDIYRFLPIAYCRMLIGGVNFPVVYITTDGNGDQVERKLSDDPLYVEVYRYASKRFTSPVPEEKMMAVLNHSAEFHAINQALNAGSELEHLVLAPPVFT